MALGGGSPSPTAGCGWRPRRAASARRSGARANESAAPLADRGRRALPGGGGRSGRSPERSGQGGARPVPLSRDPLPGLPGRVDRRIRRASRRRPAPARPPAGGRGRERRPRSGPFWPPATATSSSCRPPFSPANAVLWIAPFPGGRASAAACSLSRRRRDGSPRTPISSRGGGASRRIDDMSRRLTPCRQN